MKKIKRMTLCIGLLSAVLLTPFSPAVWALSWDQVTNLLNRDRDNQRRGGNGGSRPGQGVCLLSPGSEQSLWHLNPTFVWQGFETVGVRPAGEKSVLWQGQGTEMMAGTLQEHYTGPALERGKRYEWLFFINSKEPALWVSFRVVDRLTHWRVARGLETLQSELEGQKATVDETALARANYFLENNLPADAIQEMFAVSEPSDELIQARKALVAEICSSENPSSSELPQ